MKDLTLRIGGEGGEGVISCGEILTRSAARAGFHIFTFRTYPAEIRGGLAMFQLRVNAKPVLAAGHRQDLLVAFNQEALNAYMQDVRQGGKILYDPDQCDENPEFRKSLKTFPVPLTRICKKATDSVRGKNVTAVGVMANLLGIPLEVVIGTLKEQFQKKGEKIVGMNILALVAGFQFATEELSLKRLNSAPVHADRERREDRLILSGNQAVALGALAAGVRFCAGYPITPATPIFEFLARQLPRFGGHIIQVEDEIAAIGACIGASYAGVKSLTPTSGPGMALMGEFIGLVSMAELPLVIVDVQRSGPSTGMPTKSEQGDLSYAALGTPGEAPRVVLAPSGVEECFTLTVLATNLAERYQIPVILLSDASLAYRTESVQKFKLKGLDVWRREEWHEKNRHESDEEEGYQRYALTKTGISPVAIPGTEHGYYQATGLEHDEFGHPNYSPSYHLAMYHKRFDKLERIENELGKSAYDTYCPEGSRIGIISWGSTKGTVREAVLLAEERDLKIAHFHPILLNPLPKVALKEFADRMDRLIVVEENFTGQLAHLIRSQLDVEPMVLNKAQGIPFTSREILSFIKKVAKP